MSILQNLRGVIILVSLSVVVSIGVREGILLGGRKKFALKVTFLV